jgi:hypothetical protein
VWFLKKRVEGIEPSSLAWKAIALPLSYTRNGEGLDWGVQDSNLRRQKPSDLQSDPFDRSGNSPGEWCAFLVCGAMFVGWVDGRDAGVCVAEKQAGPALKRSRKGRQPPESPASGFVVLS